jgi:hypothetical protein
MFRKVKGTNPNVELRKLYNPLGLYTKKLALNYKLFVLRGKTLAGYRSNVFELKTPCFELPAASGSASL